MKDIDGIEYALDVLRPHWAEIERHFDEQNARFLELSAANHDLIGRILRVHLVVESFVDTFLQQHLRIEDLAQVRLTFFQKVSLLPSKRSSASLVKPGIHQLNAIRNKFGHRLDHKIEPYQLSAIFEVLAIARPGVSFAEPVDAIEAFAPVACAFLSIPPKHLEEVFVEAFTAVSSHEPDSMAEERLSMPFGEAH